MFNQYPYINLNDFNLDYLLAKIKTLTTELENFVELNTIKYANPILWDITSQYEANTVVIDGQTGTAYISTTAVPSGVSISNTDYWTPIYNYADAINNIYEQIGVNEGDNTTATSNMSIDDLVWLNGKLARITADISAGTAYVEGTNFEYITVSDFVNTKFTDLYSQINATFETGSTATSARTTNDLIWLNGKLAQIISDMVEGTAYVENTNFKYVTVKEYIENSYLFGFDAVLKSITGVNGIGLNIVSDTSISESAPTINVTGTDYTNTATNSITESAATINVNSTDYTNTATNSITESAASVNVNSTDYTNTATDSITESAASVNVNSTDYTNTATDSITESAPNISITGDDVFISKLKGRIRTILDYGATGDGTTDDSAAFNAFIADDTYSEVFVPVGTYNIASAIDELSNKKFIFAKGASLTGAYASLITSSPNELFMYSENDSKYHNMSIVQDSNDYDSEAGSGYVKANLRVLDRVNNAADNLYHWNLLAHSINYASGAGENCALYSKMDNYAGGSCGTWGMCIENCEYDEIANPTASHIGLEVGLHGGGGDSNEMRVIEHLVYSKIDDSSGFNIGAGLMISGDNYINNDYSYGLINVFKIKNLSASWLMQFENTTMNCGIDFMGGNFTTFALRLGTNQRFYMSNCEFVNTGSLQIIRGTPTYIETLQLGSGHGVDNSSEPTTFAGYTTLYVNGTTYKVKLYS